jgi:hypothetical protein
MVSEMSEEFLNYADKLAKFANLESADVKAFIKLHRGFWPPVEWKETQRRLVVLWREHFPLEQSIQLIIAISHFEFDQDLWDPSPGTKEHATDPKNLACNDHPPLTMDDLVRDVSIHERLKEFDPDPLRAIKKIQCVLDARAYIKSATNRMVWPAQFAIMFLATHPWRARFCPLCGRRFVADKQSRRYCRELCSHEARKKGKLMSWRTHGKTWRAIQKPRAKKRKSRQFN